MADRTGQQFGNYRLVSLLGAGGYAEVYLGQHVRFKQQAAIKVLHAYLSGQEAEHFQHEAETIATLAHPSIVRVFDFDVQDGVPFLVMEYAPNGSLRRRSPRGSIVPLPQVVSSVKQVADALQYAHEQKFIHRDVKPENMLLGRHQEVLRALAKDPKQRFDSVANFTKALERASQFALSPTMRLPSEQNPVGMAAVPPSSVVGVLASQAGTPTEETPSANQAAFPQLAGSPGSSHPPAYQVTPPRQPGEAAPAPDPVV